MVGLLSLGLVQAAQRPVGQTGNRDAEPRSAAEGDECPESADQQSDDSLAAAVAEAYAGNPSLAARRYDLRATDDDIGVALAQMRPVAQLQIASGYDLTKPGDITQGTRSLSDRLNSADIVRNDITTQVVVDQPVWTGGRASGAVRVAEAASWTGREALRGAEGDLLLDLITTYADIRRDVRSLAIRRRNLEALDATMAEIVARRGAGELTRTDIAQVEAQRQSARVQLNAAEAQLQASRAAFAALVGREPGVLAPEPDLPSLPRSIDEAFAWSEQANPDLAAAIAAEQVSRARIAAAKAAGMPQLVLRGTAGTTGPIAPFDRRDQDLSFSGRVTLSLPLSAGGLVRAQVAQAYNRNTADALQIEAARRQMVQGLVTAWNQWAASERNITVGKAQLAAARTFYDGTYAEYREGLRSTFDVLFALNSLREAEIDLLASRRDSYVAQASVLRRTGRLEVASLLARPVSYDPARYTGSVRQRGAVPWGGMLRDLDRLTAPAAGPRSPEPLAPTAAVSAAPDGHPAPPVRVGTDPIGPGASSSGSLTNPGPTR